ncbi:hypothetical protein DPSP01_010917 [Paraphaeosphaeria sporulosa]|uniref:Uncharacterized protein n=1 Tax=Paraphaeosphaeria sporulosa TaxID=1460663 RepID=A0A177CAF3_9PLEO|nr:uncharacterized protein CC84DRAFT_1219329 [Paraphaeosphaeria sporulosa]OAG04111.1 hypothetical protein CC84DRAFT_1219329 [Paraphaeosphaeria sporulosa]
MSPILSTLLFAAAATAQVTTSIWMPSPYQEDTHIGFYASVVGVSEGKTTLALSFDNKTDLATAGYIVEDEPNTMTFYGSSRFESVTTTTDVSDGLALTMGYGCQETSARGGVSVGAMCRFASEGPAVYSSVCEKYSDYTDVYTTTKEFAYGDDYTVTETTTIDYRTRVPSYCKSGSTLPESIIANTYMIEQEEIATYQVVITAGADKLSATAGATPSSSGPAPTGTGAFTLHKGQNVVPTETGSALPVQETGAAGALLALHPALAGLGAAAMAFLL